MLWIQVSDDTEIQSRGASVFISIENAGHHPCLLDTCHADVDGSHGLVADGHYSDGLVAEYEDRA
jgi:hypothetical protein